MLIRIIITIIIVVMTQMMQTMIRIADISVINYAVMAIVSGKAILSIEIKMFKSKLK